MKLGVGHITPGRVLKVENEYGVIKACCCGLFTDVDGPDKLPPIYPFNTGHENAFSQPHENEEIWVIWFDDNPLELLYFRKDNIDENLEKLLSKKYKEVEVVVSRKLPTGYIQFYFTDEDGWILQNDKSKIQIRKNGTILLDAGSAHRRIDINGNNISLGTVGESAHPAAYGDKVEDSLNKINSLFNAISNAAKTNPYTAAISTAIEALRSGYEESIEDISSPHVTLD